MALDVFNTLFTTIFVIEFALKLFGYGFYGYIKDAFNVFDGIIVIIRYIFFLFISFCKEIILIVICRKEFQDLICQFFKVSFLLKMFLNIS